MAHYCTCIMQNPRYVAIRLRWCYNWFPCYSFLGDATDDENNNDDCMRDTDARRSEGNDLSMKPGVAFWIASKIHEVGVASTQLNYMKMFHACGFTIEECKVKLCFPFFFSIQVICTHTAPNFPPTVYVCVTPKSDLSRFRSWNPERARHVSWMQRRPFSPASRISTGNTPSISLV